MLERRLAWILVGLVFLLILWGGLVHNTGSSLACPDWPLCFGSLLPEMKGNVAVEHSHRLLAATVGLLTIVLAILLWFRSRGVLRYAPTLKWLGIAAVFCVVIQGLLGGITVILRLPTLVSTAHLSVSMIFFSLLIVIAWKLSLPPLPRPLSDDRGEGWVRGTTMILYLQILLGAFVRHSGAGLACVELPLCRGSLWPSGSHPILLWHMAHRIGGVVVAFLVLINLFLCWGAGKEDRRIRLLILAAPVFVIIQIVLGVVSITSFLDLIPVTAHLGVAALLMGVMVSLWVLTSGSEGASDSLRASEPKRGFGGVGRSTHPHVI